jgi:GT2 family glycosyltransferase
VHDRAVTPLASVVVPTWNGAHLLPDCLASLRRQTYPMVEVVVADGCSDDATRPLLAASFPDVRLVRLGRNRGFAGNVNAGVRAARGEVVLLLNNDAEAEVDWVERCVERLEREPTLGAVASKVLFSDRRTLNSAGDVVGLDGLPRQRGAGRPDGPAWDVPRAVFGAMGGAATYRRAMLADVGLLDEAYFMYLEDVDLAFRAQLRGWGCAYEPAARVYHRGGASGGGVLESFYNGRNLIRLLVKNVPRGLVGELLPGALRAQAERAASAARAWRGAAARATLRGQAVGLAGLASHVAARRAVQSRRRVSDAHVRALLAGAAA